MNLKSQFPGSKLVAGHTTIGLERRFQDKRYPMLISSSNVDELNQIVVTDTGLKLGSSVSMTTIDEFIFDFLKNENRDNEFRGLKAFQEMLGTFAAKQIKNMVTLGGCVASAWSDSDVIPLLCALKAEVTISSKEYPAVASEQQSVPLTPEFFKPKGTSLKNDEIILSVEIPFLAKNQYAFSMKQAHRDFDTATLSVAALVTLENGSDIIRDIQVYYGNLVPTIYFAKRLSNGLSKRTCDLSVVDQSLLLIQEDFQDIRTLGKEISADMLSLTEAATWCLMMKLLQSYKGDQVIPPDLMGSLSALTSEVPGGTQVYEEVPKDQPEYDAVGRPIPHLSSRQQTTGEAQYIDDIPRFENELFLALVTSKNAHASILNIDATEALGVLGVVDFLKHSDIPGSNSYGILCQDETVFADGEVTCVGQPIGAVLATSREAAISASKLVHVEYEPLKSILTIQDAIDAHSYFEGTPSYTFGDTEEGFKASDTVFEGEIEIGGQKHFYMETLTALAVPLKEEQEITLYGPFQVITYVQQSMAKVLDVPCHKITVVTKRSGGAFGGKEMKLIAALPAAVGAFRHKRPVRCLLDRDTDMQGAGGRHPMKAVYKVGVSKDGEIVALEVDYYADAGNTIDFSPFILGSCLLNFDNCYRVPNVKLRAFACKTNLPSNTSFRGFGRPQSMMVTETWINHIADALELSPKLIRERNLHKVGDYLHFNCSSEDSTIDRCWTETVDRSKYTQRQLEIKEFNRKNKYRKKGLALSPMKFGMHFPATFMNQAQALLNVYLDGSILVHHGGCELGQGLYTKIIQVVSRALSQPVSNIHISSTRTDIINNASTTAASSTTDLAGAAVLDACRQLLKRLKPFKEANPEGTWKEWVNAAYMERVSLSVTGFYKIPTPSVGYDWATGQGVAFTYFTYGAACTEVEVDILTGQHVVLRTDIVMDVGRSLNPAIDIGQIEGAFMQGYGLHALEDVQFDSEGKLTTINALGYKIPVVSNVPKVFNVSLLKDAPNPKAVYSSKAIGEPPLLLASTVALAIKDAIKSYRQGKCLPGHFQLNCPATPEKVRALCPR